MEEQDKRNILNEYMTNGQGYLIPKEQVSQIDQLRDQLIEELFTKAKQYKQTIEEIKQTTLKEIESFLFLCAGEYKVKLGGKKGNVSLTSFNGLKRVQIKTQAKIAFNEGAKMAKELIDECIQEWSFGADSKIVALIEHAFQTDKQGNMNITRVLSLRKLAIKEIKWQKAMELLTDAMQVIGSKKYINFYTRETHEDGWEIMNLDWARI